MFYEIIYSALQCIPFTIVRMSGNEKPWFTPKLKLLVNRRYDAFRRRDFVMYNHYREKVKTEIRKAKSFWITKTRNQTNSVWKILKGIECKKTSIESLLNSFSSKTEAAEAINNVFCSRFSPPPSDWKNLMEKMTDNRIDWNIDVSVEKTHKLLDGLNCSKASGSDGIPTRLIKESSFELAGPLTHLIALSFEQKRIPKIWKIADVIPTPKCKSPTLTDLRPISIMSVFTKILEQYVVDSLKSLLVARYGPNQFGFRPHYGTTHAHIRLHDFMTKIQDKKDMKGVAVLTFDMASAFDSLSHESLCSSLNKANLPYNFVLWCCNFLQERAQRTKINNIIHSSAVAVTSGVPQGGKLSPFLFCVHMSLLKPTNPDALLSMYADDVVIAIPIDSQSDFNIITRSELIHMENWCQENGLRLNRNKTKIMFATTNPTSSVLCDINLQQNVKILGVTYSANMSWDMYVSSLCSKASQQLYALKRIKRYFTKEDLITIYKTTILSILESNSALLVGINKNNSERLEKIRRRSHRIICGLDCDCDSFVPILTRRSAFAFKMFHSISEKNNLLYSLVPRKLPHSQQFEIPFCRTKLRQSSFIMFCVRFLGGFDC